MGMRNVAFALRERALVIAALAMMCVRYPAERSIAGEQNAWAALRSGGHVALLRHALAPGTGDPVEFALGDCETQRNLSRRGKRQAARIGQRLRDNGIREAWVLSSQWCRCRDTAELLGLGAVEALPALNSFFDRPQNRAPQMRALRAWLMRQDLAMPLVLVTHQVNITALTGVYPQSGELVVVRPSPSGEVKVIGTVATD